MTRADAGLVADEIGKLRMYGDGPSAPRDFFGQLARSGDPAERMSLRLGDSTYGVARDAMADAMERRRSDDVVRVARALHRGEQEASPGRAMPPLDSMSWTIARKLPARASQAEIEAAVEREASLLEPAARRELASKVAERLNPDMPGYLNVGRDEPGRLPPPGVEASRGRVRRPPRTDAEKRASVLAAQRGPKPAPVGDIFTALNAAIATVRERTAQPSRAASPGRVPGPLPRLAEVSDWSDPPKKIIVSEGDVGGHPDDNYTQRSMKKSARGAFTLDGVAPDGTLLYVSRGMGSRRSDDLWIARRPSGEWSYWTDIYKVRTRDATAGTRKKRLPPPGGGRWSRAESPGRVPEPDFPEGGLSIVSGGHRMGPYATWEQAADQLLRERRAGSTAAHARAGLRADRDLSPEQARHLVELAAKRALAAQEAARRDREQLAAIILRG
jgi:hypothetical protein